MPSGSDHSLAVVVATRNRADRLEMLLTALAEQTYGAEHFAVVVVDDGSTDRTPELLDTWARSGRLRLSALRQPQSKGPAAARNTGWRASDAELIAFTDDDCQPVDQWLENMLETRSASGAAIVQGMTLPDPAERDDLGVFSRTLEIDRLSPHYPTCNILYTRSVLQDLSGFDEEYGAPAGEDTDLGWRAREAGHESTFAPTALVYHAVHRRGPWNTLRDVSRATDCVKSYRDHPGLRVHLAQGFFFHPSHPLLAQAVLACAMAAITPWTLVFAAPYAAHLVKRCRLARSPVYAAPALAVRDAVEVVATLRGALRHRVAIL